MSATEFDLYERPPRPSLQTWLKHAAFLVITLVTATIAGVLYPFGTSDTFPESDPQTLNEIARFIATIP